MKVKALLLVTVAAVAVAALYFGMTLLPSRQRLPPQSEPKLDAKDRKADKIPVTFRFFHWSQVESSDYREYVANLRKVGCPRQTIADIITTDVNQLFRQKASNLLERVTITNKFEYWRGPSFYASRPKVADIYKENLQSLNNERVRLIEQLLGEAINRDDLSWAPQSMSDSDRKKVLEFIHPERRAKVLELSDVFTKRISELFKRGLSTEELQLELRKIQNEADKALSGLLPPDEKQMLDWNNSPLGDKIRRQYDGVDLSRDEFHAIYALRKQLEDNHGLVTPSSSPEAIQAKVNADAEVEEKVAALLGDDRYAQHKRLQDEWYKDLLVFAQHRELPEQSALNLYDIKALAEATAGQIRQDPTMATDARQQRLSQLKSETEQVIKGVLGEEMAQAFLADRRSRWLITLEQLTPKPDRTQRTTIVIPKTR